MARHTVSDLDHLLSDRDGDGAAFSPAALARLDRAEEFPGEACAALDRFGIQQFYVDSRFGGRLTDYSELLELLRTVAGHDLTVAVAHGKTFLGSVPTWIAGTPEQAERLAAEILDGAVVCWALTEPGHGGDLLAGELSARPVDEESGRRRLDGQKWLINNATRSRFVCVLARTSPAGQARGFSLFLVDKRTLAEDSFHTVPKIPTHGIRGADISGIVFDGAEVDGSALIGEVGSGLETVLKALQLTRTMCAALSLGAADHGLRLAATYTAGRHLFGHTLADLPHVRAILGEAVATVLTAEVVSVVAARSVHALPAEMSVVSAVVKALVPTLIQEMLERLAELMGVRSFLTEDYEEGAFAKLERDHRIVAIFDGSTPVNRTRLVEHFPILGRAYEAGRADTGAVAVAASLCAELPPFDAGRLRVVSARGSSVMQDLPRAVRSLHERAPASLAALADELLEAAGDLHRELREHRPAGRDVPQASLDLAEKYELCFAGAAALQVWLAESARPESGSALWSGALWVEGVLTLVLRRLGRDRDAGEVYGRLAAVLLATPGLTPPSLLPAKPLPAAAVG
nr:hypothetical protein [bacterium]